MCVLIKLSVCEVYGLVFFLVQRLQESLAAFQTPPPNSSNYPANGPTSPAFARPPEASLLAVRWPARESKVPFVILAPAAIHICPSISTALQDPILRLSGGHLQNEHRTL